GVDAVLDQWDLGPGDDVPLFIERGLKRADRVLLVCTPNYVERAEQRKGGVGYEGAIVTAELIRSMDTNKFIPVVREKGQESHVPVFLASKLYMDFTSDSEFDERLEELISTLHGRPTDRKPPLGEVPARLDSGPAQVPTSSSRSKGRLAPEEIELLLAAAETGQLYKLRVDQIPIPWVRVGRTDFWKEGDLSYAAAYTDALDSLCRKRLAQHDTKMLYILTGAGFAEVKALGKRAREMQAEGMLAPSEHGLAILRLLASGKRREVTSESIAADLHLSPEKARHELDRLHDENYLDSLWFSGGDGFVLSKWGRAYLDGMGLL
ncbi:toll/interleukin-1 receptor domain-containing protein, partial [bacterium]|nr:toll/interleukin-1 receptor domain-containing protein [bacterium]